MIGTNGRAAVECAENVGLGLVPYRLRVNCRKVFQCSRVTLAEVGNRSLRYPNLSKVFSENRKSFIGISTGGYYSAILVIVVVIEHNVSTYT